MINQHMIKKVDGLDNDLLLVREGYLARPVTLDKSTITGLQPTDKGRYIIPQGTYLVGGNGSLLVDPQQIAKEANVTVTKAKATLLTYVEVTSKIEGAVTYAVKLVASTSANAPTVASFDTSTSEVKVVLGTDAKKVVNATLQDVVDAINNDTIVNTYVVASLTDADHATDVAAAATGALAGGGNEAVTGDIDGILYHSVDVTDGENTGALIIHGVIDIDKMPKGVGAAVRAKLPRIMFGRKD
ncbi:MAG: hypothetical protein ACFNQH_01345 [Veillonella parvula]